MVSLQAFTIIAKNYVPFARVLARSFRASHPDAPFFVFVVDEWDGYIDPAEEPFELLDPDAVSIPVFDQLAARYQVIELSTAVKPWVMRHLIDEAPATTTLYLDPDIKVYDSLDELGRLTQEHGMTLIPHLTQPIPRDGRRPSEVDILISGVYNLGFLGLQGGPATDQLLAWWAERLERDCRVDPSRGVFVDQRWIDLAPGMLDAAIVRDPGFDVAYWNLHYRELTRSAGGYRVNGRPLRFFHFSGYDPLAPNRLSKHQNRIRLGRLPELKELCDDYGQELLAAGHEEAQAWRHDAGRRGAPHRREAARASVPAIPPDAIAEAPTAPRSRSLGERIVDLEKLIEGTRRSGAGRWEIAREVLRALTPLRGERSPSALVPPNGIPEEGGSMGWGVNVVGYLNAELGVGEVARQTILGLKAWQVPLAAVSEAAPSNRNGHQYPVDPPGRARFDVNLLCVNADELPSVRRKLGERFFDARLSVGLWNWEVQTFPDQFVESFGLVDEVWTCSQHTADAFAGLTDTPVARVRIPVCPDPPARVGRKEMSLPDGFLFLFMFDHLSVFERKNPLGLIAAFADAFAPGSEASLVIKCLNGDQCPANHELLIADAERHPNVYVIDSYLDKREKNALVVNSDCYVSLHRAEGFGLTLAEAMYFGKPVIATGYSGNLDFMSPDNGYLVDYELMPIGAGNDPYPPDAPWAEPDLDRAAALMRHVFEHREEALELGRRGAADIRRTHSPRAAGETMWSRLEVLRATRPETVLAEAARH